MDAALRSLRVLIVDPNAAFRSASRALFETEGLDVVADFALSDGVLEAAAALRPDVALVDVSPYQPDGLALARALAKLAVPPGIALMSVAAPDEVLAASVGANVFVSKAGITADAIAYAALASRAIGAAV